MSRDETRRVHHVRLGTRCLNACVHCKYRLDVASTRPVVGALYPVARGVPEDMGPADEIYLTGPEPAIQSGFASIVRAIVASGAHVSLYTTGRPFAKPGAAGKIAALGVRKVVVPVFGATAEEHDAVAGSPGAFARTRRGVAELARHSALSLRLDVLVVPRNAQRVGATVAAWRDVAPAAELRLVHLQPLGGGHLLPDWFERGDELRGAVSSVLTADTSMTTSGFSERAHPWSVERRREYWQREPLFAALEKGAAACTGPLCPHCVHDYFCDFFRRRKSGAFDTYNLTVEAPCDLACSFCMKRATGERPHVLPLEELRERLAQDLGGRSIRRVRLNGSDPVAHPDLLEVLRLLATYDVASVELYTPGLCFVDADLAERVFAALEPFESTVLVPVYGADAETHDTVVGCAGAFARLDRVLTVLEPHRARVRLTTLVLRQNYRQLEAMHALARERGFDMEPARFVRPFSPEPADYAAVVPRMRDVVEFYRESRDPRRFLGLFMLPPCVYWDIFPAKEPLDSIQVDAGSYDITTILRNPSQVKTKLESVAHCDQPGCVVYERCFNQVQYFRVHGFEEFRPLDPDGVPQPRS